jgi:hypothetical protein
MGGIGSIGYNPDKADVVDTDYQTASVAVSTSQVEAKTDTSTLDSRQLLTISNKGPNTLYYGPSGVTASTGDFLLRGQTVALYVGPNISVYMICATGKSATAIVQEYS